MATFVLVHGAFGGCHEFRLVRAKLLALGHDVFTPSLTGIGERSHLSSPQVTLDTHIEDVENVIVYWDLHDVALLGFSYGGMVVTGVASHMPERIAHLIYLDAILPMSGESLDGLARRTRPKGLGAPWLMEPLPRIPTEYDDPVEEAFNAPRRTPQPIKTFAQTVTLTQPLESYPFTRTYIRATGEVRPEGHPSERATEYAKSSNAWTYLEIDCNHLIPSNRPDELVERLVEIV